MKTSARFISLTATRARSRIAAMALLTTLALLSANAASQNVTVAGSTGANGSYATLGAAFTAINANTTQSGNAIIVAIVGDTNEGVATATLNQPSGGSWTTLTISPSGGAARTISGATTAGSPLIDLNGADNVTVNGLNTGGNSLTIANTTVSATTGTSTIRFINGATNNTITNSNIQGSGTMPVASAGATIFFSTDASTPNGNDNNTISNNNIGPAGSNLPTKAIFGSGSTTTTAIGNSGIVIDNNNIFDYFDPAVTSAGIATVGGCNTWSITNNRFYQTGTRTWTTGAQHVAINIANTTGTSGAQGFTITGNIVGFASNTQTGTYTLTGSAGTFRGIFFSGITAGVVSNINSNTVAAVSVTGVTSSGTSSAAPFIGIYVNNGVAITNSNTVGSQSATGSLTYATNSASAADAMGIFNFSLDAWTANNNLIGGITSSNAGAGAANAYGMRLNTSSTVTTTLIGNTVGGTVANSIQSTSTAAGAQVAGIFISTSIATVTSNTIRNLTNAGGAGTTTAASVVGIDFISATPVNTASQNTIFNLSNTNATAASIVTGIQFTGATGNVVERNLIHSLTTATNSATAELNGIRVGGGTTIYRNNMIAIGTGTTNAIGAVASNAATTGVNGINEVLGTNSFFHNSVYIGGSPSAGPGTSYAFNGTQITVARSFRDNIFFNARSNSGATGKHYAVKINGTTPSPTGLTINNNVYFANGVGAVFGFFNSLDVANLAAWKTAVGQDAGSFESNPQYLDPTNAVPDLHLHPTNVTVAEANGADVGVTNDFDGQTRASLTPIDIGADAGNFNGVDLAAPSITYTPLGNTSLTSNRILSVTITDVTGVATAGVAPRVYYKKNAGADFSQACSLASGTVQNGTWNCTINYASVGGVVSTDLIRYYVVAQDTLGNLAANPSAGFAGTNVNTVTTPPTTPNQYNIAPAFAGSINVGATEALTSLTNTGGLFDSINAGALTGNVTINLTSDLTAETGTVALNQWVEDGVGSYTLLIKPSGAARTISGTNAGALIRLNGADRVTIDGSTTGATATGIGGNAAIRELTIQNTNVGTAAVVISVGSGGNGAQNNTIRNVNVLGQDPLTTLLGISLGGTTPGTVGTDNDNNRIENCSIKRAIFGIYSAGASAANPNTGTVITMNETSAVVGDRIRRVGIFVFSENGIQITLNSINGVSTNESADAIGIAVGTQGVDTTIVTAGGVTNALVARNKIDGVAGLSAVGFSAAGITVAGTTGGANTIVNNMITGVTAPATSPDLVAGIYVVGASGSVTRLYHNSIAMTGDRGAVATQTPSYGVAITGVDPTVELKNNIFYTTQIASGGGVNAKSYAIGTVTTTFANLDSNYNDFFTGGANAVLRSGSLAPAAGTDYATLALWRIATVKDANSLEVDPVYLNPLNDLHLNPATTPLRGAGITGFAAVDFDNDPRPLVNPDIGADQLVSDLTLSKAHVGANFSQGQNGAQYTLIVSNTAAVATLGTITVSDTLPTGLTLASGTGTGWSCGALLQVVTCTNPATPIAGSGNSTITLNVNVAANAAASLQNTASVACTCAESNTGNNTSNIDTVTVVQRPDLTLSKAHVGANFAQGQNGAQYTLIVINGGAVATSGTITVTDTLPTGLTFASGTGTGWSCSAVAQLVTCTNPATPIAASGNSTITLSVNVAANAAASLQNTASVACTCTESNTGNNTSNTDTVSVSSAPLPDLVISKSHSGNFAQGQIGATYTVTVTNSGVGSKAAANLVSVVDTPPPGLVVTAMSGAGWSCALLPTCTRSDALAAGQSYPPITVTVSVLGNAATPQVNTVAVTTTAIEINTANNSAVDSTTIVAGTLGSLAVSKSGSGTGTVASADGGINCGASCTSAYVNSSIITLTATPTGGAVFTGWLGACTGTGTCTVTINGARTVSATFAASPVGARILDINNDNQYLPASDGVLVLRYLFGLRGASLTNGLTLGGTRTDPTQIEIYLKDILPYFDVDGNGVVDALTDGLLIMRQLSTPSGPLLIQNAIGLGATRVTATDVNNYILTLRP